MARINFLRRLNQMDGQVETYDRGLLHIESEIPHAETSTERSVSRLSLQPKSTSLHCSVVQLHTIS